MKNLRSSTHAPERVLIPRRRRRSALLTGLVLLIAILALGSMRSPEEGVDTPAVAHQADNVRACDLGNGSDDSRALSREARVLAGLAAYACQDWSAAAEQLSLASDPTDPWEDWRLYSLAASAREAGQLEVAAAAVDTLLELPTTAPLRPLAYGLGVDVAIEQQDPDRALRLIRDSREAPLSTDMRSDLDVLGWEAAQGGSDTDRQEMARQLLLDSPADADDLGVDSLFRAEDGTVAWGDLFDTAELHERSANLLAADMAEPALATLEAVAEEHRDIRWHLLRGQALIDLRRGTEALDALDDVRAADLDAELALGWLRAEAALDAATARRGRRNLPSAEREQMRLLAHGYLWQIVRLGNASPRAVEALRLLFEELADGEHFEQVRSILLRLKEVSPDDTSGTRYLWRLGWAEYRRRNLSGAIGYWSELVDIYPHTRAARGGRYWSARSHEALGNRDRSATLYEMLASSPSTDYYGRLARERLEDAPEPSVRLAGDPQATWPEDARLERAARLTAYGLDSLALTEIDQLQGEIDKRAETALRSRVLARQGRRRESIQLLWQVFPVLGGAYQDDVPPDALPMYYPLDYLDVIRRFAHDNELSVALLLAMIRQESAFDIRARSRAGARGLMQVMPATGRELAAKMGLQYSAHKLNDPAFSVQLGSRYFRQVLDMFDGQLELALAGYNAGPYRIRRLVRDAGPGLEIDRFVEDLRFEESKSYVKRIILFEDSYQRLYPDLG